MAFPGMALKPPRIHFKRASAPGSGVAEDIYYICYQISGGSQLALRLFHTRDENCLKTRLTPIARDAIAPSPIWAVEMGAMRLALTIKLG